MRQRYEIRHIPVWPAMKFVFIALLVVGILFAVFYAFMLAGMGFLAGSFGESVLGEDMGFLRNLGFVMIPIIAISYAIFGTIAVVIWLVVYNVIASIVGGIEVEMTLKERWRPGIDRRPIQVAEPQSDSVTQ